MVINLLNRKQRNKMAVVKEGLEVHEVLVQEGVYSFEKVNDAVAEPETIEPRRRSPRAALREQET